MKLTSQESPLDALVAQITDILREARKEAYKSVNQTLIRAYWDIGKRIVEDEQSGKANAEYGKKTLTLLAKSSRTI